MVNGFRRWGQRLGLTVFLRLKVRGQNFSSVFSAYPALSPAVLPPNLQLTNLLFLPAL